MIKEMKLKSMKVTNGFDRAIDEWRMEINKEHNVKISKSGATHIFKDIVPMIKVNVKTVPKKKQKIFELFFDPNMRRNHR